MGVVLDRFIDKFYNEFRLFLLSTLFRIFRNLTMKQAIYADSLLNISLADGVVRFDLVTLTPSAKSKEDKKMLATEVAMVATSLPGFLRMHEQMTDVLNQLIAQGVITRNSKAKEEVPAEAVKK
jgi:hypothetical protein